MVQRRTAETTSHDEIQVEHNRDGIDPRGFLKCMAGAGALCVLRGKVLKSHGLSNG